MQTAHTPTQTSKLKATLIGYSSIVMWGTLPLLVKFAGDIPPFQLTALAFALAFGLTLGKWKLAGEPLRKHLWLPLRLWLLGIFGLFGFHFCYFMAFRYGPAVEVYLIDNLWPLLIILLSTFMLKGEKVHWFHIVGVACGFAGVALIILKDKGIEINARHSLGYLFAFACATIWSVYSVLCRKWAAFIPKEAVGAYCGITALLSLLCHFIFETWQPLSAAQWLWIALMGLGPVGFAFFTWDYGMRHGDIRMLGALTYTGTLLGLALLIAFGYSEFSWKLALAAALILGGACLGSLDMLRAPQRNAT